MIMYDSIKLMFILFRLHDLSHLLILYPNESKDKVFGKYYTPMPSKPLDL